MAKVLTFILFGVLAVQVSGYCDSAAECGKWAVERAQSVTDNGGVVVWFVALFSTFFSNIKYFCVGWTPD
jgi:hypothetical protein